MTTFAKKKQGAGRTNKPTPGLGGLQSRDKLKKHHFDPKPSADKPIIQEDKSKIGAGVNKAKPKPLIGNSKYKANSKSNEIDVNKITSEVINMVDNNLNPLDAGAIKNSSQASDPAKKGIPSIYNKYKKISPRAKGNDVNNSSKNSESTAAKTGAKSSEDSKSGNKRNYHKPWQRPQTAGSKVDNSKKVEDKSKKVSDIAAKRKQFKPALVKKQTDAKEKESSSQQFTNETFDIEIENLENELAEKHEAPKPYPSSAITDPYSHKGMRKLRSAEVDKQKASLAENDGVKHEIRKAPVQVHAFVDSKKDDIKIEKASNTGNKRASKMINDIKQKRKNKNLVRPGTASYADETTGLTLDSHSTEDVHLVDPDGAEDQTNDQDNNNQPEEEEEKLIEFNNSGDSKGSSGNSQNNADVVDSDDENIEDVDAFNFADDNFDDDFDDLVKSPLAGAGLDEIREDDEIEDEMQIQLREAKARIKEIEGNIQQGWNELYQLSDENTAKTCYEYFKENISDENDINDVEKMELVHKFVKKQGVVNYRPYVFE